MSPITQKGSDDAPPKPPPKTDDLIPNFNGLSISPNQGSHGFVGGFNPAYAVDPRAYVQGAASGSNIPLYPAVGLDGAHQPIAMPTPFSTPQSLTMQHALRPPPSGVSAARPHSNPLPAPPVRPSISATSSTPPPHKKPASTPSTPVKKAKLASAPVTPASAGGSPAPKPGYKQCAGRTLADKPCSRMVKIPYSLSVFEWDDDDSPDISLYCRQHSKGVLSATGFNSRKAGLTDTWVKFEGAYSHCTTRGAEIDVAQTGFIHIYSSRRSSHCATRWTSHPHGPMLMGISTHSRYVVRPRLFIPALLSCR